MFNFFNPSNLLIFISVFSPVILACIVASSSIVFGYEKGLVYLGYLIMASILREIYYYYNPFVGNDKILSNPICSSVRFGSANSNSSLFSLFVFTFTICYMIFPMYSFNTPNFAVFSSMLVFMFADLITKMKHACIPQWTDIAINALGGSILGILVTALMIHGGSGSFLFFEQSSSSTREQCSRPSEQTFKCAVYKNGELLANID